MIRFLLTDEDIEGQVVAVRGREVVVDRYSYILWKSYAWIITYDHYYLHRFEEGKRIVFHRQLLNVSKNAKVSFVNGNRLDCRIINLDCKEVDFALEPHVYNLHRLCYNWGYTRWKRRILNNRVRKCA